MADSKAFDGSESKSLLDGEHGISMAKSPQAAIVYAAVSLVSHDLKFTTHTQCFVENHEQAHKCELMAKTVDKLARKYTNDDAEPGFQPTGNSDIQMWCNQAKDENSKSQYLYMCGVDKGNASRKALAVTIVMEERFQQRTAMQFLATVMQEPKFEQVRFREDTEETRKEREGMLRALAHKYNTDPPMSAKMKQVDAAFGKTKDMIIKNMEEAIGRGAMLDVLADESESLANTSKNFQKKAKSLKGKYCCRSWKYTFIIIAVVLLIILVILLIACNPNFSKCK